MYIIDVFRDGQDHQQQKSTAKATKSYKFS